MQPDNKDNSNNRQFWIGFAAGATIIVLASFFALPSFFSSNHEARAYAFLGLGFVQIIGFFVVLLAACIAGLTGRQELAQGLLVAEIIPFLTCGVCAVSGTG